MSGSIEITLDDVTDFEAHVLARYTSGPIENVALTGHMTGPFCEGVHTLTADFAFRPVSSQDPHVLVAEAVVTDPCLWSAEMPHVYDVDIVARIGDQVVAEHHGKIGLRRLSPRRPVDFAPGTG